MAGSIKGIIVEIGGDTSGLQKALSKVNSATSSLSRELRGVNSLLKLDPKNTELLKQKQDILNESIVNTQDKLKQLQELKEQADDKMANGTKINSENYRALQREIITTENKLKNLQAEASKWTTAGRKVEEFGKKVSDVGNKIDSLGNKLTTRITTPLLALGVVGIKSATEQETAIQQIENIYGDASNTIKDFAENTAITFNMSTKEAYKYSQVYGNLIQSITDDEEENALYTQQLLEASAVIASSTGRTMEDVMDRIRSGLLGNTEAIEDLGVNVNVALLESTDSFKKFAGDKSWDKLDFQTQQQIRLFGILEQTTKKYGKEVNKNTASSIQKLTARLNNLVSRLNKKLIPIAEDAIDIAEDFIEELEDLSDEELENIINIGLMIAKIGPLVKILGTVTKTVGTASKGIGIFSQAVAVAKNGTTSSITSVNNLAKAFSVLTSPTGLLVTGFGVLTGIAVTYEEHQQKMLGNSKEIKKAIDEEVKSRDELIEKQKEKLDSDFAEIGRTQELYDELKGITNENGKIKDGYEKRANYIVNQLSEALGIEIDINKGVIESYQKIQDEIDKTILKKKAESIVNAGEEAYSEAIEKRASAYERLEQLEKNYREVLIKSQGTYDTNARLAAESLKQQLQKQKELIEGYNTDIANYERNQSLFYENTKESLTELVRANETGITKIKDDTYKGITSQIEYYNNLVEDYKKLKEEQIKTGNDYRAKEYEEQEKSNQKQLEQLSEQLTEITTTTNINEPEIQEAWKNISTNASTVFFNTIKDMPEDLQVELLKIAGVINKNTEVENSMKELAKDAEKGFNNNVDGAKWGSDLTKEMSSSMTNQSSKSRITKASSKVASWISQYLHFSVPDKGPLSDMDKSMPDMIDLMVKGIDNSKIKLIKSAERLAKNLNNSLNLQSNIPLNNFENAKINSQVIDSTKTIFTTPTLNIYAQDELTPSKMNSIIDTVNKRLGSQY